jgi:hypothetical protein
MGASSPQVVSPQRSSTHRLRANALITAPLLQLQQQHRHVRVIVDSRMIHAIKNHPVLIGTAAGNTNLIQVDYSTNSSSSLTTKVSTTLSIPVQGWCPT